MMNLEELDSIVEEDGHDDYVIPTPQSSEFGTNAVMVGGSNLNVV